MGPSLICPVMRFAFLLTFVTAGLSGTTFIIIYKCTPGPSNLKLCSLTKSLVEDLLSITVPKVYCDIMFVALQKLVIFFQQNVAVLENLIVSSLTL